MSKLNPQKATAYVGPGVLKQGGKITPVPNGPLIKKKGPFKGSTLKSGGPVKKKKGGGGFGNIMGMVGGLMGGGGSKKDDSKKEDPLEATKNKFENSKNLLGNSLNKVNKQLVANQTPDVRRSLLKAGGKVKKAKSGAASTTTTKTTEPIGVKFFKEGKNFKAQVTKKVGGKNATYEGVSPNMNFAKELATNKSLTRPADSLRTAKKNGGMIKRADGSYSKRGLWDNIRANKGSGKKPTKQMLQQEKKIKAKTKK